MGDATTHLMGCKNYRLPRFDFAPPVHHIHFILVIQRGSPIHATVDQQSGKTPSIQMVHNLFGVSRTVCFYYCQYKPVRKSASTSLCFLRLRVCVCPTPVSILTNLPQLPVHHFFVILRYVDTHFELHVP